MDLKLSSWTNVSSGPAETVRWTAFFWYICIFCVFTGGNQQLCLCRSGGGGDPLRSTQLLNREHWRNPNQGEADRDDDHNSHGAAQLHDVAKLPSVVVLFDRPLVADTYVSCIDTE